MGRSLDSRNGADDVDPAASGAIEAPPAAKVDSGNDAVPPYAAESMMAGEQAALIDYKTLTWW